MATDGFGNYLVRVTDTTLGVTTSMTPLDARYATTNYPSRYTALDPFIAPLAPLGISAISPTGQKLAVAGSKAANAALGSLVTALATLGLISDNTS